MYFPYMRGKQFELQALRDVSQNVFSNTLPIVEPTTLSRAAAYANLAANNRPLILITNPLNGGLSVNDVQTQIIDAPLQHHNSLTLAYQIDHRFNIGDLHNFLISNAIRSKTIIFRFNPLPADLAAIVAEIQANPVTYVIFDGAKVFPSTQQAFNWHNGLVLITDGFQKQIKNSNYPALSIFGSNFSSYAANGWAGIGDYLTIGDNFSDSGGPPLVVTLHLTILNGASLETHHYSSTMNNAVQGGAPPKFLQACATLVTSPTTTPLNSTGLTMYRNWHANQHFPQLGGAKQASMQHHIELLSSIV